MSRRFLRTELLLGPQAMEKLRHARVAVAGLGAVGSYAVEGLARAGVGHLRLADFDEVHESNINRQLYALESTRGRPKVDVARERVLDINPACEVELLRVFLDRAATPALLRPPIDILIDAIDSVGPKVELLAQAVAAGIPVISSMGAATRTDPLLIRAGDISETEACPLARFVRKRLRRRGIETGIECIYSTEPPPGPGSPEAPGVAPDPDPPGFDRGRVRRPMGSLSCITGMFGLIAARQAIFRLIR